MIRYVARWALFLLLLPFRLGLWLLWALYVAFWHVLFLAGHAAIGGLGVLAILFAYTQSPVSGEQLFWMLAGWAAINRGCFFLTRLLPRGIGRPKLTMPKAPPRPEKPPFSPVSIAVRPARRSASPSEAVMFSRLSPALQAIMTR